MRFTVLTGYVVDPETNKKQQRSLIALKDEYGRVIKYTHYEYFCIPYTGFAPTETARNACSPYGLHYVCHALNYIFFEASDHFGVSSLDQVTLRILDKTINHYVSTPKDNGEQLSQQSINKYIRIVCNFFAQISLACPSCAVTANELFYPVAMKKEDSTTAGEHVSLCFVPTIKVKSTNTEESTLLRDIPDEVLRRLIRLAKVHDPMIVFAIVLGKAAGMRLGEVTNTRQENSPISSTKGIKIKMRGSEVSDIFIDLKKEYQLRADGKSTGMIKRERTVEVHQDYKTEVINAYHDHLKLLDRTKCYETSMPMFVDSRGHAMTDKVLSDRFRKLVDNHLVQDLLSSGNPDLEAYAQEMMNSNLRFHALRHYFTVRMIMDHPAITDSTLAYYRGDKSEQSSTTYIRNKGRIKQLLMTQHANAITKLSELAEEAGKTK